MSLTESDPRGSRMRVDSGQEMNGNAAPDGESAPSPDSVAMPPPPPPSEGLPLVIWRLGGLLLTMRWR